MVKVLFKEKKFDCLLCGEVLIPSKEGGIVSKDNKRALPTYVCGDCDQMFVLQDDRIKLVAYDAEGKKIMVICKICNHKEFYRQKMVFICVDGVTYDSYCKSCAFDLLKQSNLFHHDKLEKIKDDSFKLQHVADLYSNKSVSDHFQKMNINKLGGV